MDTKPTHVDAVCALAERIQPVFLGEQNRIILPALLLLVRALLLRGLDQHGGELPCALDLLQTLIPHVLAEFEPTTDEMPPIDTGATRH